MAGSVVSNIKKYYGGQVPVPGQGDSDGKVKVLVEKTATIEIEGVQTEVELLYDADDLTTPVTPQQLGQWTDENYLIAFKKREDDGRVRGFVLYALETDNTSTDTLVNRAEFISFKEDMSHEPGASAYEFAMIEDSSTLARYLRDENGELIVKFDKVSVEDGAQSDTLDNLIGSDSGYMRFEVVREGDNAYLNLNTESLDGELDDIWEDINYLIGAIDELPSDEHGYFNSTLVQTPGDGTTENIVIDDFRISENRDVHGESIEFVPTHQEGGIDYGEVYLEPGTYILAIQYTLQWVGNPRGTFLPKVCNVADQPFDFSYEHEDVVHVTRIVTRTTRGKLVTNIAIDVDTPPMGVWVKNMEVVQVATFNHSAVAHDTTLTGTGKLSDPLGVTPAAFGKIKDIPTSISQFRTGDVIPVDGPNGPAKIGKDDLLMETAQNALAGNVASAFDPNKASGYKKYQFVVKDGVLYRFDANHAGAWTGVDAHVADLSELSEDKYFIESNGEFAKVLTDSDGNMICAITGDGNYKFFIKVSFVGGVAGFVASDLFSENDNPEYVYQVVDSEGNLICSVTRDGDFKFDCGVPHQIQNFVKSFFTDYSKGNVEIKDGGSTSWTIVGAGCDGAKHNYCSGFGYHVLRNNTGIKNITMGSDNMENASGDDNTSMGYHSQFRLTSGNRNASHGSESQDDVTSGKENTSAGFCSLQRNNTGDHNVAIGAFALQGIYENRFDPENLKKLFDNTVVGYKALYNAEHLSEKNVALGMNTLGTTRKYINCIAIGYGADCDADNKAVIGNSDIVETKVFGDLVVDGTDKIKRRIVFNNDGTCSWTALT